MMMMASSLLRTTLRFVLVVLAVVAILVMTDVHAQQQDTGIGTPIDVVPPSPPPPPVSPQLNVEEIAQTALRRTAEFTHSGERTYAVSLIEISPSPSSSARGALRRTTSSQQSPDARVDLSSGTTDSYPSTRLPASSHQAKKELGPRARTKRALAGLVLHQSTALASSMHQLASALEAATATKSLVCYINSTVSIQVLREPPAYPDVASSSPDLAPPLAPLASPSPPLHPQTPPLPPMF
eukprot:CAMPEP_0206130390 /NCGR_PEP_ID=MMETSP1472-20131121/40664_1 /ASSEMBLY_ACC=CAM_ASM_001108 /TAXON_ID=41880 /ORGANISM="Pycnococcus provasolii, Strain RCC251" /LENGTH=238 /DNA_ID=CAMNT_0053521727 /DNA_START=124 /DNA_END=842 /DNA_ORIENTATION=+